MCAPSFHVLSARFPYYPEHVIVVPKGRRAGGHAADLRDLTQSEYSGLIGAFEKILTGSAREAGPGLIAQVNEGKIAAQTIPHMHAHVFPQELGEPAREVHASATYADPLSRVIALHGLHGWLPMRSIDERGAVVIRSPSFSSLRKPGALKQLKWVFGALEFSFNELRSKPELVNKLAKLGEKPARLRAMEKVLRERTSEGFGVNWGVRLARGGGVEVVVIPRATVVSKSEPGRRIAGFELFGGAKLNRTGLPAAEEAAWNRRQKSFEGRVKRWVGKG